jgi:hypothetical protein
MTPARTLWQSIIDAAAANVANLAAATAMHLHLAIAPFSPGLDLDLATLVEATFTGGADKNAGTGTQQVHFDVTTGFMLIQILEPAGGWTWECTADPPAPETVYGVYLTNTADTVLHGSELLPDPVTIEAAGQGFTVPRVTLSFAETSPF